MFNQIPTKLFDRFKRIRLLVGEYIASKNPECWVKRSVKIDFGEFCSSKSAPRNGLTTYTYRYLDVPLGEVRRNGVVRENSLPDFWNEFRMVAEVHDRMKALGEQLANKLQPSVTRQIILSHLQVEMLNNHPQHQAMIAGFKARDIDLKLFSNGNDVYIIAHNEQEYLD